jgi:hypothetical protein
LLAHGVVQDDAISLREDEHPLAILGRTNLSRREYSPRWLATAVLHSVSEQSQFGKDFTQSEADVPFHIFKEAVSGANNLNCPPHKWPEVSGVVGTGSFAGGTERLARVARNEDVHQVSKEFAWEAFTIRPDRKRVHASRFNFRDQIRVCVTFDLTSSDAAQIWDNSFKSEMIPSVAKAPFDAINCFGSIHILVRLFSQS